MSIGESPLPAKAVKKLKSLNQVLARDEEFGQIVARDHKRSNEAPSDLKWEVQRRWRSPEALLIPIAKAMAELVCSEDFSDIKRARVSPVRFSSSTGPERVPDAGAVWPFAEIAPNRLHTGRE